jgi:ankyrin repeat protein
MNKIDENPLIASRCQYFSPPGASHVGANKSRQSGKGDTNFVFPWRSAIDGFLAFTYVLYTQINFHHFHVFLIVVVCLRFIVSSVWAFQAVYSNYSGDIFTASSFGHTSRVIDILSSHTCDQQQKSSNNSRSVSQTTKCSLLPDTYGNSPLHVAVEKGFLSTVSALLRFSLTADVASINLDGNTPLHLSKSYEMTHLLISQSPSHAVQAALTHRNSGFGHSTLSLASSLSQANLIVETMNNGGFLTQEDVFLALDHQISAAAKQGSFSRHHRIQIAEMLLSRVQSIPQSAQKSVDIISRHIASMGSDSIRLGASWWLLLGDIGARRPFLHALIQKESVAIVKTIASDSVFAETMCSTDENSKFSLWSDVRSSTVFDTISTHANINCMTREDIAVLMARSTEQGHGSSASLIMLSILNAGLPASSLSAAGIHNNSSMDVTFTMTKLVDRSIALKRQINLGGKIQSREISVSLKPAESLFFTVSTTESKFVRVFTRADSANVAGYKIENVGGAIKTGDIKQNNWLGWYPSWISSTSSDSESHVVLTCGNRVEDCHFILGAELTNAPQMDQPASYSWFYIGSNLFAHARLACMSWLPLTIILPTSMRLIPLALTLLGFYAIGPMFALYWTCYTLISIVGLFLWRLTQQRQR